MDFSDPLTLALIAAAFLLVCAALDAPVVLRVIRMHRFQRMLGKLYWPFIFALDERDNKFHRRRTDEIDGTTSTFKLSKSPK